MTQEDIIRMAREAGFVEYLLRVYRADEGVEHLARAAYEAGAAAEREACAKVADLVAREIDDTNGTATYIAAVIRARSKT
jgi:hypothetical protein